MSPTLTDGMTLLDDLGIEADYLNRSRVDITVDGEVLSLRPLVRDAPPTPSQVQRELDIVQRHGESTGLLFVVDHASVSLAARALANPLVAVVEMGKRRAIVGGRECLYKTAEPPRRVKKRGGRVAWGRMAVGRVLLRTAAPRTQVDLAAEAGVSQQVVQQSLHALAPNGVGGGGRGSWRAADPSGLWDHLIAEYPGHRGLRRAWTAVASPREQIERAQALAGNTETLLSGDSAADELAPWRRSRRAVLYAPHDLDLSARFAPTDSGTDPTLEVVVSDDPTVFATAAAWADGPTRLTDPIITAWEVAYSAGPDARDAVARLKERTLSQRGAA
jgi:hypothetical protein